MNNPSAITISMVFFLGVAFGSLATAVYRYVLRDKIQRDFQARLVSMIESREQFSLPRAINQAVPLRAPAVASAVEIDDVDRVASSWIPQPATGTNQQGLRL